MTKGKFWEVGRECCRCGECPHARDRNSDGWQKCFTNVPPGASRVSADLNVKMFLAASAMPWMGSLPALLTVANVVSIANSNFQLATLVLIIGNILTLATFSKIV